MNKLKPIIKFNGGKPVALCNNCNITMCYLSCREEDGEYCKVKDVLHISKLSIGNEPPIYCDKCDKIKK